MATTSTSSSSYNTPFTSTSEAPTTIFGTVEGAISTASKIYKDVMSEKSKHEEKLKNKNNSMYLSGMSKKIASNAPSTTQTVGLAGASSFVGYVWKTSNDTQRIILLVFLGIAWLGFLLGVFIRKQTKLKIQSKDKTANVCTSLANDQAKITLLKDFLHSANEMLKAHDLGEINSIYNTMYNKSLQPENRNLGLHPEINMSLGSIWTVISTTNISAQDKVKKVKNVIEQEFIAALRSEVQSLKHHVKQKHDLHLVPSSNDVMIPMEDMSKGKEVDPD